MSTPHWQITPVAVASLPVPGWECVFGRNDSTLQDIIFWVWIIRCGDVVGLIDAGLPEGEDLSALNVANQSMDSRCVFSQVRTLPEILQQEGLRAEDIGFVLVTQWITYATGGLSQANFPQAHIYAAWGGMHEFLTAKPGHPPREFYLTQGSWAFVRELLVEDRLTFAQGAIEVAPGVIFEPTGGHHPGSAGVRIQTNRGTVGILETAFIQENIERAVPIGIAENAAECRAAIETYRKTCDLVLAGHEPSAATILKEFLRG